MRRRAGAWMVLVALLFQVLAAPALARGMGPPAGDDVIVVCTAAGMVSIHRNGTPVEPERGAAAIPGCVFCLPLMQGHLAVPMDAGPVLPTQVVQTRYLGVSPAASPILPRLAGGAHPQAPPVS